MNDYEGVVTVTLNGEDITAFYLAPYEFAREYLRRGKQLEVDLWLFDSNARISQTPLREIRHDSNSSGRLIKGQVKKCFTQYEFRVDCGPFEIDVLNEIPIDLCIGEYIETRGSYQIFLPSTDYTKDAVWN